MLWQTRKATEELDLRPTILDSTLDSNTKPKRIVATTPDKTTAAVILARIAAGRTNGEIQNHH